MPTWGPALRITCLLSLSAADDAGEPPDESGRPLLARLVAQVHDLGLERTVVLCDPASVPSVRDHLPCTDVVAVAGRLETLDALARLAELAQALDVVDAGVYGHRGALEQVLLPPAGGALALLGPADVGPVPVLVRDGRVEDVGAPVQAGAAPDGGQTLLPVLHIGPSAMAGFRRALSQLRSAGSGGAPLATGAPANGVGMLALLTLALVRTGEPVDTVPLGGFVMARPVGEDAAKAVREEMEAVNEERVRLGRAVKARDGFFTTFLVSPYSRYVARWCARRGWRPDQVTVLSLLVGLVAAGAFGVGAWPALVAGAVLLQAAFVLDCVDGQLARYARAFSARGAWLDSVFDRIKEYAVYAGLAAGAVRTGDDDSVWWLAGAALAFQALRHHLDFAFTIHREALEVPPPRRSLDEPWWRPGAAPSPDVDRSAPAGLLGAARRLGHVPGLHWVKAIVILPIGERFAVISVGAVLLGARGTFVVLLGWGAVAAAYLATGRLLRSRR
jgi:hypothetical protein